MDTSSTAAAEAIAGAANWSGVTPQLATEGYLTLKRYGNRFSVQLASLKARIDKTFPLCKLHTEPLTADEQSEVVVGPVPIDATTV